MGPDGGADPDRPVAEHQSDLNSERAFELMRAAAGPRGRRWPRRRPELADAIRPGGLANIKAPRILAILRDDPGAQDGSLDLSWMRDATDAEVTDYLLSLPGVGPKTAACVLAFSLGRDAIPVDTHVFRVAERLGFLGERADPIAAHRVMAEAVPPKLRVPMHVGLIRLGREICKPGRPGARTVRSRTCARRRPSSWGSTPHAMVRGAVRDRRWRLPAAGSAGVGVPDRPGSCAARWGACGRCCDRTLWNAEPGRASPVLPRRAGSRGTSPSAGSSPSWASWA